MSLTRWLAKDTCGFVAADNLRLTNSSRMWPINQYIQNSWLLGGLLDLGRVYYGGGESGAKGVISFFDFSF